jgi:dipicolinate synthase subunit A
MNKSTELLLLYSKLLGIYVILSLMSILILAGDLTNHYLYKKLKESGYNTTIHGFEHLIPRTIKQKIVYSTFKTIIVPIPFTLDNEMLYSPYSRDNIYIDNFLSKTDKGTQIIGGPFNFNDERLYDITKNRDFTNLTVIPTCEELIKIIIEKSDVTISESTISIFGEGRIKKHLTKLLKMLNATISLETDKSDIIINTTNRPYISGNILDNVKVNSIIIDVAPTDGGVDYKQAKKLGINIIKARGLPSKSAPKSVSNYIFDTLVSQNLI